MFETILVPLDGSELAEAALAPAVELQARFGSRLVLLRAVESVSHRLMQPPAVIEPPAAIAANVELIEKLTAADREEAQGYLATVRSRLAGKDVETLVVEGAAAAAVVAAAAQRSAGLIVMSSHGRGGLGRIVFGSVADAVLRQSGVPVLLVRAKLGEG